MKDFTKPDGIYKPILTIHELEDICNYIKNNVTHLGVDTETDSLDYLSCNILGVSLAYKHNDNYIGWYLPLYKQTEQMSLLIDSNAYLKLEEVRDYLNDILSDTEIVKILHNAKFDMHVFETNGINVADPIFDTMIASWVYGNRRGKKYGLKDLAKLKLGFDMLEFSDIVAKGLDFSSVPLDKAVEYAGPDGDMTLRLYETIQPVIKNFPTLEPTLLLEQRCIAPIKDMEKVGVKIDREFLQEQNKRLIKPMKEYENIFLQDLGKSININSGQQLLTALQQKVDSSLESTEAYVLKKYIKDYPWISNLLEYKKRQKLSSVYCTGILNLLDDDDRVHTEYYQMLKTGRLSSKKPNLQNIPTDKKDELPLIRRAFIPKDGCKIVAIDYSQLELRVITHVSQEDYWINAFLNGLDIHSSTAAAINHTSIEQVTKLQRRRAKTTNFGLLYGETAYGLSIRENMEIDDAQEFINNYFQVLPKIEDYIRDRKKEVLTQRYTETFNGRRLYFDYNRYNSRQVGAAQREGINFPIQGGAADIVKKAMVLVWILLHNYKSNMILQVHDELVFEMYEDEMDKLIPKIVNIMTSVFNLRVPLLVDVEIGDNWQDIKEIKI